MTHPLDFSTLPSDDSFGARSMLIGLANDVEARLLSMPQTLERIQSAIMFAGHATKQSEPWRAAAFLRAALAEYCVIEEVQRADKPNSKHFKLSTTTNPLLTPSRVDASLEHTRQVG